MVVCFFVWKTGILFNSLAARMFSMGLFSVNNNKPQLAHVVYRGSVRLNISLMSICLLRRFETRNFGPHVRPQFGCRASVSVRDQEVEIEQKGRLM